MHQFTSNFAQPTVTSFRLAVQNFTSISVEQSECVWQNIRNCHYSITLTYIVNHLTDLWHFQCFYTRNYCTLLFEISSDSHHRSQRCSWQTARQSIRPYLSIYNVQNTIHYIKKWLTTFFHSTTGCIIMHSLDKIVQCAMTTSAKIYYFFYLVFVLQAACWESANCQY